jgi:hypothetical protein
VSVGDQTYPNNVTLDLHTATWQGTLFNQPFHMTLRRGQ